MTNDWFKYDQYSASTVSEFIDLLLHGGKTWHQYRGHREVSWELEPPIDRVAHGPLTRSDHEIQMFREFKQRGSAFLQTRPANDGEFLALARHHGLPTRLLDWTEDNRLPSIELLAKIASITKKKLVVNQPGFHLELACI